MNRTYAAIDLKSYYASAECVDREMDPLTTNLVVADLSRTEKTICLAVSPGLKSFGIPGRPRLFEVVEKVRFINAERARRVPGHRLQGSSTNILELAAHPELALDYIVASPRMAHYIEVSTKIYQIYLRLIAAEDIHVYSIDEVFIDLTGYLRRYACSARELTMRLIRMVLAETGITATAGIGTNLYLAKIAMDIVAKHMPADKDGVRIAELDEKSYRRELWNHQPLTDFWRIGHGYERKLAAHGLYTMGDVARCSIGRSGYYTEELLYKLFGVNAELLIDHAWGGEPCTIADIKGYHAENHSLSSGQVLKRPYTWEEARVCVLEMADAMALDLVEKGCVGDQFSMYLNFDSESLNAVPDYQGPVQMDYYGRVAPKQAHGSQSLGCFTSSSRLLTETAAALYDRISNPRLLLRRLTICVNHVIPERDIRTHQTEQLDLFTDYAALECKNAEEYALREREKRLQKSVLELRARYGSNAVLKGISLTASATQRERNIQIGGHKA